MTRPAGRHPSPRLVAALALCAAVAPLAACTPEPAGPPIVRPGGPDGRPPSEAPPDPEPSLADVRFLRHMIAHHAQAVELAGLAPGRAADAELLDLAERIALAQAAEIDAMTARLEGRRLPDGEAHDDHDAAMPGLIPEGELALARAETGGDFERRFIRLMIAHHEGAIEMIDTRLAEAGDPSIARLAGSMADAQRLEIDRLAEIRARLEE